MATRLNKFQLLTRWTLVDYGDAQLPSRSGVSMTRGLYLKYNKFRFEPCYTGIRTVTVISQQPGGCFRFGGRVFSGAASDFRLRGLVLYPR